MFNKQAATPRSCLGGSLSLPRKKSFAGTKWWWWNRGHCQTPSGRGQGIMIPRKVLTLQGTFREHFGNRREHLGNFHGTFREHQGTFGWIFQEMGHSDRVCEGSRGQGIIKLYPSYDMSINYVFVSSEISILPRLLLNCSERPFKVRQLKQPPLLDSSLISKYSPVGR